MKTGCARLQVAPATLSCTSSRSAGRSQWAAEPARASARTLDGEPARRLSTLHSDTQLNYQPADLNCLSEQVPAFTIKQLQAGADRPFSIVVVSNRPAEIGHDTVAEILGNVTAESNDRFSCGAVISSEYLTPFFGIEARRNFGGAYEIAEQYRQMPPLAGGRYGCGISVG